MTLPYRKNVCAIIMDEDKNLLIVKRTSKDPWQFIQGGMEENESFEETLKRELKEETAITEYKIIGKSKHINQYDWPEKLQTSLGFQGQVQTFFVIEVKRNTKITPQKEEIHVYKWVPIDKVLEYSLFPNLVEPFKLIRKELIDQ